MNIKTVKNKIFLFIDNFRAHRIHNVGDLYDPIYHCQYQTLFKKQWKTYKIYKKDGWFQRAVYSGTDPEWSYNAALEFMKNKNKFMFIK